MKHRTHRLRRVAAALALGVGGVGGVVGLAAGTAGAAVTGATIHASSSPSIASTGSGQKAGTLTLTLPKTGAVAGTVHLHAAGTTGTVDWSTFSVSSSGGTAVGTAAGTTLDVAVVPTAGTSESISITGITYTTSAVHGTVAVTPTTTLYQFKPTDVVNAIAPAKPATIPATTTVTATAVNKVVPGVNGQKAGTWNVKIHGAKGTGWAKTDTVTITVLNHAGNNCSATTGYVLFTGTPSAKVTKSQNTSTTPTVTTSVSHGTDCGVTSDHNQLTVTFTNSGTLTTSTNTITISISGIKYDVGATTVGGIIEVAYVKVNGTAVGASTTPGNATVTKLYVSANTPPKQVPPDAIDASISPVKIFSDEADGVAGYVCLSLNHGTFNPSATAKATQTGGKTGKTTPKVVYETSGGTTTTKAKTTAYAMFHVVTEVTKTLPVTYSVSGLAVDATTTAATVTVTQGASKNCSTGHSSIGTAAAFTVGVSTTQIYGATSDATAAAAFEYAYPPRGVVTGGVDTTYSSTYENHSCPGTAVYTNDTETGNPLTENRPVVLATTKTYADALSSQYLASFLKTGTLLTPTTSLSSATVNALRVEGISSVYIVGGPLAVTTTVVAQLETLPVYNCGGTLAVTKTGKPTFLQVTRIFGATQYTTAEQVAEYVGGKHATFSFVNAYDGTNKTDGTGMYNDTAGKGSTHPNTSASVETAILASGKEFQDAEAASTLSYTLGIPLLLTTPLNLSAAAKTAISDLHVKQVILMGGPLAVTNTVVTQLGAVTVSVLRIAGKTYTDTAVQLAKFELGTDAGTGVYDVASTATHHYFYDNEKRATVSRGNGFTDGLAGAVAAANADTEERYSDYSATSSDAKYSFYTYTDTGYYTYAMPLLLTQSPSAVGAPLTTFLKAYGASGTTGTIKDTITSLNFLGGPLSITPTEINAMETDIG